MLRCFPKRRYKCCLLLSEKGAGQEVAPGINETLEDVVRTHKQPGVGGGYQDNLKRESRKQSCVGGLEPRGPKWVSTAGRDR